MTDDDVVKYVMEQHTGYWDFDGEDKVLDYYLNPKNDRAPFKAQAAQVSMNVLVFQNWRKHLTDALEVVKNWKPE